MWGGIITKIEDLVLEMPTEKIDEKKWNLDMSEIKDFNDPFDGRGFFYNPESLENIERLHAHGIIKKMPSGREKVISKRIPISVDYRKMLEDDLIKVENCSNCWQVTEGKIHIDVMVWYATSCFMYLENIRKKVRFQNILVTMYRRILI